MPEWVGAEDVDDLVVLMMVDGAEPRIQFAVELDSHRMGRSREDEEK